MRFADSLSTAVVRDAAMPPLLVLAPYALRKLDARPRRYLDPVPMPACGRALIGAMFEDDEQLEREYSRCQTGAFSRLRAAWILVLRNYSALRRARMIYCLDGMHYNLLLFLSRSHVFQAKNKIIRRLAFHDSIIKTLAPLLKKAAPGFQIEFITHEQCSSASRHLATGRIIHRPWKIDAEWYRPAGRTSEGPALLPGNASRDESMVDGLLERGVKVTRMGRSDRLSERFAAHLPNPAFRLATNTSHLLYREILDSSSVVLLPILPCDDPAGLTAAMESIVAGIPVIANRSMGLHELFAACNYPVAMMENRDPAAWAQSVQQTRTKLHSPEFIAALARSRDCLLQRHAILSDGEDWTAVHRAAA